MAHHASGRHLGRHRWAIARFGIEGIARGDVARQSETRVDSRRSDEAVIEANEMESVCEGCVKEDADDT